jgi:ligand-binding SRPBCC domain-containing protein
MAVWMGIIDGRNTDNPCRFKYTSINIPFRIVSWRVVSTQ